MRETKAVLEAQLRECRQEQNNLRQDNEILKREISFISKLTPNASMIIAIERVTDALAHTIQYLTRR